MSTYSLFRLPPCPTSLNIVLYPSHWQPPLSPSARTAAPFPLRCRPSLNYISSFPTKLSHMSTYPTSSSLQSRSTIQLTAILFEFLYPWILFPHTGNIVFDRVVFWRYENKRRDQPYSIVLLLYLLRPSPDNWRRKWNVLRREHDGRQPW